MKRVVRGIVKWGLQFLGLIFTIATALFFLLRLAGDPATILAGQNSSPEVIETIRRQNGFDAPLGVQYLHYLLSIATLRFGDSLATNSPAMAAVGEALPWTILLALLAVGVNILASIPIGLWLGYRSGATSRRIANGLVFVAQGIPGYVVGLLLIQLFAVQFRLLPSFGVGSPLSWIMPALTLAAFVVPRLLRVISVNVSNAMSDDFVRTARAIGSSERRVLWNHVAPNALLPAIALLGTQFSYLLSGALITEVIFSWPGVGQLLIRSLLTLDFPVVEASVIMVATLVFLVNAGTDLLFLVIDPRQRRQRP